MAIVKSKLLQKIYHNYPNFYKKDLEKFLDIILKEIKNSLKRGDRVEFRGFGTWSTNKQKNAQARRVCTHDTKCKIKISKKCNIHLRIFQPK